MAIPEVYQITHSSLANGQTIQNSSYWIPNADVVTTLPDAYLTALLTDVAGKYRTQILPNLSDDVFYQRSVLHEINGYINEEYPVGSGKYRNRLTIGRVALNTTGVNTQGQVTGDALPYTVSAVCHWLTGRYGRRRRGRMKIGPLGEAQSSGNQLTTIANTSITSGCNAYRMASVVGSPFIQFDMVVFSPTSLFALPGPGNPRDHTAYVNNELVVPTLGVQYSRKYQPSPS
jgi:hypothetical protein